MEPVCGLGGRLGGDDCGLNKAWGAAGCRAHSESGALLTALPCRLAQSHSTPGGG